MMKSLIARPKNKTVAIVGFASTTRGLVDYSNPDEVWSLNWWYTGDFLPTVDRMFEMHPIWTLARNQKDEYEKPRKHWEWLKRPHKFPIYMLEDRPEVPACVRYPIEDVAKDLFGDRLMKGSQAVYPFGSSIDYMMALAIHEKFKRIELYGVEMGSMTEYRYQRETMATMMGIAVARGIEVYVPEESILLKTKLYGYEGGQMIFRQDLERLFTKATERAANEMARLQFLEGRLANGLQMQLQYKDEESKQKLVEERDEQMKTLLYAEAMKHTLEYLIREVDGEETDMEIKNPLRKVSL